MNWIKLVPPNPWFPFTQMKLVQLFKFMHATGIQIETPLIEPFDWLHVTFKLMDPGFILFRFEVLSMYLLLSPPVPEIKQGSRKDGSKLTLSSVDGAAHNHNVHLQHLPPSREL